jgi:hypothetical protein
VGVAIDSYLGGDAPRCELYNSEKHAPVIFEDDFAMFRLAAQTLYARKIFAISLMPILNSVKK